MYSGETMMSRLFKTLRKIRLDEALPLSVAREYRKGWDGVHYLDWPNNPYRQWFDNKFRVYLPLIEEEIFTPPEPPDDIVEVLAKYNFEVLDYEEGTAKGTSETNKKQTTTIARILSRAWNDAKKTGDTAQIEQAKNRLDSFNKELRDMKQEKKEREERGNKAVDEEHLVVICRHPYDIAGMSTGIDGTRGWVSCQTVIHSMNPIGSLQYCAVKADIKRGTLIAYYIEKDDKNIRNPLGRMLIKPYYPDDKSAPYLRASPETIYVRRNNGGFPQIAIDVVQKWLYSKQGDLKTYAKGKWGQVDFSRGDGLYNNNEPRELAPTAPSSPEAIDQMLASRAGSSSIVADWIASGRLRPTTELLMKQDTSGSSVAFALANKRKLIRSVNILKLVAPDRHESVLYLALKNCHDTDRPRYFDIISKNPELLTAPAMYSRGNAKDIFEYILSELSTQIPEKLAKVMTDYAKTQQPKFLDTLVVYGLMEPSSNEWYIKKDASGVYNIEKLLKKISVEKLIQLSLDVFSQKLLMTRLSSGNTVAYLILSWMYDNRRSVRNDARALAMKEHITRNPKVMKQIIGTGGAAEPLACWWGHTRPVFWTNDIELLALRSPAQNNKTLAHILAANYKKNHWIPRDREILNWKYEENGKHISVRDVLVQEGAVGLGQKTKREGGAEEPANLDEKRKSNKKTILKECVSFTKRTLKEGGLPPFTSADLREFQSAIDNWSLKMYDTDDAALVTLYKADTKKLQSIMRAIHYGKLNDARKQIKSLDVALKNLIPVRIYQYLMGKSKGLTEALHGDIFQAFPVLKTKTDILEEILYILKDTIRDKNVENALQQINILLDEEGVQTQKLQRKELSPFWKDVVAVYIKRGNPQLPTIIYDVDSKEFIITSITKFMDAVRKEQQMENILTDTFIEQRCVDCYTRMDTEATQKKSQSIWMNESPVIEEPIGEREEEELSPEWEEWVRDKGGSFNYETGRWDFDRGINLSGKRLKHLPLSFGHVDGGFSCSYNQLTSLEGAPQSVSGDFYCGYNQLTSLEGAPQNVGGYFSCGYNQLTSLEGAPQNVDGVFDCSHNQLTSLEGAPQSVSRNFDCSDNPRLPQEEIQRYRDSGAVQGNIYEEGDEDDYDEDDEDN